MDLCLELRCVSYDHTTPMVIDSPFFVLLCRVSCVCVSSCRWLFSHRAPLMAQWSEFKMPNISKYQNSSSNIRCYITMILIMDHTYIVVYILLCHCAMCLRFRPELAVLLISHAPVLELFWKLRIASMTSASFGLGSVSLYVIMLSWISVN